MRRTDHLLSLYSPSVVVLKNVGNASNAKQRKRVITSVMHKLVMRSVEVHMVKRADVRQTFRQSGNRNKYEIASTIAQMFPELRQKVPPKRKAWQPERYNAVIFDSVALALAHQSQCEACAEPTNAEDS